MADTNSGVTGEQLVAKIKASIDNVVEASAVDQSDGCGAKFLITVITSSFKGLAPLKRHRLVHAALGEDKEKIHAMTLVTKTPEELSM